jgi:hypothetical protein
MIEMYIHLVSASLFPAIDRPNGLSCAAVAPQLARSTHQAHHQGCQQTLLTYGPGENYNPFRCHAACQQHIAYIGNNIPEKPLPSALGFQSD